ncbi:sulfotransferase family 2 domain-containing protein [Alteromonas facilis]|uniref:sulfotransferase family 2 domain-containing protein n=1 Tax=Alteromonas facilis TaxID=2048004 RepID=UPI000C28B198|nr:sulfotransferase family 2 domain-containing protein [Alteromonas facilis]
MIAKLYQKCFPKEWRLWFYKLRHQAEIAELRTKVTPSPKGDFSLAPFDQNQCVFVHITKTAGTSVALTLFDALPYHYQAWQYRVFYGRKTYNDFFKFAFVRNPWDRLYSAFSYLKGGGWNEDDKGWAEENLNGIDDFNVFVLEWLNTDRLQSHIHFWPQSDFICDAKGKPIIDYMAYFETIADDFDVIAKRIGCDRKLVHKNASKRAGYKDVYNQAAIDKVSKLYATDISNFGYQFDTYDRKQVLNGQFVSD